MGCTAVAGDGARPLMAFVVFCGFVLVLFVLIATGISLEARLDRIIELLEKGGR